MIPPIEYPIHLAWDMSGMLDAKVKVAKDLKREFEDVLNQYQDKFTKNM